MCLDKGDLWSMLRNNIKEIVGVMEGDCSNTKALIEVFKLKGIKIYPFSFPHSHSLKDVEIEIRKFMDIFNVKEDRVEQVRKRLNKVRKLAKK